MIGKRSCGVQLMVLSLTFLADVLLLRPCQDRNHPRLKFCRGKTVFVVELWDLIKANLLTILRKIIVKSTLWSSTLYLKCLIHVFYIPSHSSHT